MTRSSALLQSQSPEFEHVISTEGRAFPFKRILWHYPGRDTYALLKAGALDGLSIGYVSKKDSFDRTKNVRRLEEIHLFEISIVTFPMLPSATVEA
ncbi:HK97 family phage prohead protease [Bradyrhizobium sp. LM2.7]